MRPKIRPVGNTGREGATAESFIYICIRVHVSVCVCDRVPVHLNATTKALALKIESSPWEDGGNLDTLAANHYILLMEREDGRQVVGPGPAVCRDFQTK